MRSRTLAGKGLFALLLAEVGPVTHPGAQETEIHFSLALHAIVDGTGKRLAQHIDDGVVAGRRELPVRDAQKFPIDADGIAAVGLGVKVGGLLA